MILMMLDEILRHVTCRRVYRVVHPLQCWNFFSPANVLDFGVLIHCAPFVNLNRAASFSAIARPAEDPNYAFVSYEVIINVPSRLPGLVYQGKWVTTVLSSVVLKSHSKPSLLLWLIYRMTPQKHFGNRPSNSNRWTKFIALFCGVAVAHLFLHNGIDQRYE